MPRPARLALLLTSLVGTASIAGCDGTSTQKIDDHSRTVSTPRVGNCGLPSHIDRLTANPARVYATTREIHAEVDIPNIAGEMTKLVLTSEPFLVGAARTNPPSFPKRFDSGFFPLIVLHYTTDPRLPDAMPDLVMQALDDRKDAVTLHELDELSVSGSARNIMFQEITVKRASALEDGLSVTFEHAGERIRKTFEFESVIDGGCALSIGEFVFASP